MEKIIETKTCKHCGASFHITDKDLEFYEKISPIFPEGKESCHSVLPNTGVSESEKGKNTFTDSGIPITGQVNPEGQICGGVKGGVMKLENGKVKYLIPTPTLCPDCRQQRRLSFRNERNLYKRKCSATGEDIISIYSPDKPYRVYSQDFWWSDKWNPLDYGPENGIDFSQSFFEQFKDLMKEFPLISLNATNNENSLYVHLSGYNKNCYLLFAGEYNEDCL